MCFVIFIVLLIIYLFTYHFLKKESKKVWDWVGGEDLGGDVGGESVTRIYCMNFQLKKTKLN